MLTMTVTSLSVLLLWLAITECKDVGKPSAAEKLTSARSEPTDYPPLPDGESFKGNYHRDIRTDALQAFEKHEGILPDDPLVPAVPETADPLPVARSPVTSRRPWRSSQGQRGTRRQAAMAAHRGRKRLLKKAQTFGKKVAKKWKRKKIDKQKRGQDKSVKSWTNEENVSPNSDKKMAADDDLSHSKEAAEGEPRRESAKPWPRRSDRLRTAAGGLKAESRRGRALSRSSYPELNPFVDRKMATSFLSDLTPMVKRRKWLMKLMKDELEDKDDDVFDDDWNDEDDLEEDDSEFDDEPNDVSDDVDDDIGDDVDHLKRGRSRNRSRRDVGIHDDDDDDDVDDNMEHLKRGLYGFGDWTHKHWDDRSIEDSESDESSDGDDGDEYDDTKDMSKQNLDDDLDDFEKDAAENDDDSSEENDEGDSSLESDGVAYSPYGKDKKFKSFLHGLKKMASRKTKKIIGESLRKLEANDRTRMLSRAANRRRAFAKRLARNHWRRMSRFHDPMRRRQHWRAQPMRQFWARRQRPLSHYSWQQIHRRTLWQRRRPFGASRQEDRKSEGKLTAGKAPTRRKKGEVAPIANFIRSKTNETTSISSCKNVREGENENTNVSESEGDVSNATIPPPNLDVTVTENQTVSANETELSPLPPSPDSNELKADLVGKPPMSTVYLGSVEGNKTTVHTISFVQPEGGPEDSHSQSSKPVFVRVSYKQDGGDDSERPPGETVADSLKRIKHRPRRDVGIYGDNDDDDSDDDDDDNDDDIMSTYNVEVRVPRRQRERRFRNGRRGRYDDDDNDDNITDDADDDFQRQRQRRRRLRQQRRRRFQNYRSNDDDDTDNVTVDDNDDDDVPAVPRRQRQPRRRLQNRRRERPDVAGRDTDDDADDNDDDNGDDENTGMTTRDFGSDQLAEETRRGRSNGRRGGFTSLENGRRNGRRRGRGNRRQNRRNKPRRRRPTSTDDDDDDDVTNVSREVTVDNNDDGRIPVSGPTQFQNINDNNNGDDDTSETTAVVRSPFINHRTAYDFLSTHGRARAGGRGSSTDNEYQAEQWQFSHTMSEGMCEVFNKHFVPTNVGGRCE